MADRKTINITYDGEISHEPYFLFEEQMNEAILKNRDVKMYFTTNGGFLHLAQNIVNIINNFPNNISIIASGYVYSAGMYIVTNVNCDVKISPNCSGMIHFPYQDLNSKNLKDEDSYDYFASTLDRDMVDEYLKNIKEFLTEEEIKKVNNGKEVYIKANKLEEIISNKKREI